MDKAAVWERIGHLITLTLLSVVGRVPDEPYCYEVRHNDPNGFTQINHSRHLNNPLINLILSGVWF